MSTPSKPIAEKLFTLLQKMLSESNMIPKMYHPVIMNLVKPQLRETDESELEKMIIYIRDEVIPWILSDDNHQIK